MKANAEESELAQVIRKLRVKGVFTAAERECIGRYAMLAASLRRRKRPRPRRAS